MRARHHIRGIICIFLTTLVLAPVTAYPGGEPASPAAIQKKRTATMKTINKNMRLIKVTIGKGQYGRAGATAAMLAELIVKIPGLSPEGSAFGPKSRIKPEVWKKFALYKDLSERSAEAARSLAKVAKSQDREKVMGSFLSLARSCSKCHKPFRKKKKRR